MGLNEFSGYVAVAGTALETGWIAAHYALRPQPFYLGIVFVACGLGLSAFAVRDTRRHVLHESVSQGESPADRLTPRDIFWRTTIGDRNLSSVSQAGLVNNLNDGMTWGLFPLVFAAAAMSLEQMARSPRSIRRHGASCSWQPGRCRIVSDASGSSRRVCGFRPWALP
jgi:hypothetical protein